MTGDAMPLPPPAGRREIHRRSIDCRGYRRDDGLWDVEAHLVDSKTRTFTAPNGRTVPAGEPVHGMWVRLTVDEHLVVRDLVAVTEHAPYPACPGAAPAMASLVGLRIASGWNAEVRRRLGGRAGCTHLVELLGPLATTAYQALAEIRLARPEALDAEGRPRRIDSCHAYAADGALVRERWPEFHEDPGAGKAPAED
jgi:hypothetical protein